MHTLATSLLTDHHNLTSDRYFRLLEEASRKLPTGELSNFIAHAALGFVDELHLVIPWLGDTYLLVKRIVGGHSVKISSLEGSDHPCRRNQTTLISRMAWLTTVGEASSTSSENRLDAGHSWADFSWSRWKSLALQVSRYCAPHATAAARTCASPESRPKLRLRFGVLFTRVQWDRGRWDLRRVRIA